MIEGIWDRLESALKAPMGPKTFFEDFENLFHPGENIIFPDWRPLDEIPTMRMDNSDDNSDADLKQQVQSLHIMTAYHTMPIESSRSTSTQSPQSVKNNRQQEHPTQNKLKKSTRRFPPFNKGRKQDSTSTEPESRHLLVTNSEMAVDLSIFASNDDCEQYELREHVEVAASLQKLPRLELLQDLCKRFGFKSPQLKLECDMICNEIRSLKGVKYVYCAYQLNAINSVTFVVTIENDQDKHAVETYLKHSEIEYDIKMLQFKNDETTGSCHRSNMRKTDVEINRLRECIKTHAPELFFKHKYLSIIQGCMRQVDNKETEEKSHVEAYLELYVHAKGYIPIEEVPFEKKYDGISVHVRDGVFLPFGKHANEIHDNIRMGCSISRRYEKSGTLGLFIEHAQYGLCGIASAHVLLSDTELEHCKLQFGKYLPQDQKEVFQPRFPDLIGKLVEVIYKEGTSSIPGLEIGLIAIENRKPEDGRFPDPRRGQQLDINYSSGKADIPRENNLRCVKFGSSTNYTTGIIDWQRLTFPNVVRTLPWTLQSGLTKLTLYNQLRIEPTDQTDGEFADFGDSGSPVFVNDGDGQPVCVGIVAGGITNSRTVMVTPISVILEEIGFSKFKTFKPNIEKMQQDIHTIKHQLFELAQFLLPPRNEYP